MNKYIASTLLAAFLCSSAFADSDGPYTDGDGLKASFDRMLNHRAAASVQTAAIDRDVLQEAFAASLWGDAHANGRHPVADASKARASPNGSYTDGVATSFNRMLNYQPAVSMLSIATERDVLQDAFAAVLWSSPYASGKLVADASAPQQVQH